MDTRRLFNLSKKLLKFKREIANTNYYNFIPRFIPFYSYSKNQKKLPSAVPAT